MIGEFIEDSVSTTPRELNKDDKAKLEKQNSRLISEFKALKLETDAKRNWDIFYKNNGDRFFKNRQWTTREFYELIQQKDSCGTHTRRKMLEVGCGVGNLIFPLVEENSDLFIYACDLSPRAVEYVQKNDKFDSNRMKAFQCDITTDEIHKEIELCSVDIITMVFVLSSINPEKFSKVVKNLSMVLKPGGILLFRDYGLFDMAQLRFKPGNKISENFYVRQDGTRSYYFSVDETEVLFRNHGFDIIQNNYIHRRTINVKEKIDVPRIFLQGKYLKPKST